MKYQVKRKNGDGLVYAKGTPEGNYCVESLAIYDTFYEADAYMDYMLELYPSEGYYVETILEKKDFKVATENQAHKWKEVIKAWADGKTVQFRNNEGFVRNEKWNDVGNDNYEVIQRLLYAQPHLDWRIKPQKKIGWIVIGPSYPEYTTCTHIYDTKEKALDVYKDERIACIQIEYEGEGL